MRLPSWEEQPVPLPPWEEQPRPPLAPQEQACADEPAAQARGRRRKAPALQSEAGRVTPAAARGLEAGGPFEDGQGMSYRVVWADLPARLEATAACELPAAAVTPAAQSRARPKRTRPKVAAAA